MNSQELLTFEEAVLHLRTQPESSQLLRDSYLDGNLLESAERFLRSGEFAEVQRILSLCSQATPETVLDLGSGTGVAAFAFARSGVCRVYAVEPDPSAVVGRGAIQSVTRGLPVEILGAFGEAMPLESRSVDVVYARQVLHHAADLPALVAEAARVLKPGGVLMATREHVVSDDGQLEEFLASHPIHQLAGCEGAYTFEAYARAIAASGLRLVRVLGPLDSVVNAYPLFLTQEELEAQPELALTRRFGVAGKILAHIPAARAHWWRPRKSEADAGPGRMYSFVAVKGAGGWK